MLRPHREEGEKKNLHLSYFLVRSKKKVLGACGALPPVLKMKMEKSRKIQKNRFDSQGGTAVPLGHNAHSFYRAQKFMSYLAPVLGGVFGRCSLNQKWKKHFKMDQKIGFLMRFIFWCAKYENWEIRPTEFFSLTFCGLF